MTEHPSAYFPIAIIPMIVRDDATHLRDVNRLPR